jgi:hypothetical protein
MPLTLPEAQFFTGIDWASAEHAVCVMSAAGKITAQFTITHSAEGIASLVRRLARYGDPADLPVAIERPSGRLVDLLLEAGHPVVPVSPNAIKTWREGEVLSGAKSDAGDAAVIAEYLRLRSHRLQPAAPYSDETKALRTAVRTRDDLVQMRVAATNQLAALLDAHWPGAKAVFADVESPVSPEFLTRYPTPAAARHLGEKRMAAFLTKHGYSGRRPAAQLLDRLRQAPPGSTGEALTEALRDAVLALAAVLRGQRRGQGPGPLGRRPPRRAPGRADLHVAAKVGSDQRRPDARRVGRLPPSLRRPGLRRRPRRRQSGHPAIRQAPIRQLPLGLQQTVPPRHHDLRRQQPARQSLGSPGLRGRPGRRKGPPARHPHPGPRLDPRYLALLDQRRALRPNPARRGSGPRRTHFHPICRLRLTQGVSLPTLRGRRDSLARPGRPGRCARRSDRRGSNILRFRAPLRAARADRRAPALAAAAALTCPARTAAGPLPIGDGA